MLENNDKENIEWDLLTEMRCPKCGTPIQYEPVFEVYRCLDIDCGFKVKEAKFNKIVHSIYNPKPYEVDENGDNFEQLQML